MLNEFDGIYHELVLTRRSLFRVAGATLAVSAAFAAGARSAERAGAVEDVRGEAFAETDAVRRGLQPAGPLFVGDQVGTGFQSRLAMRLGRTTLVRLGERARLTLDRFLVNAGGEITLQSGPMLFDRPGGGAPLPVQIRTPFGLIAVRGTRFFAGPSNERFGVFVERGSVVVSAAGRRVLVRAGEGSDIAYPGAAPTPAVRWGEARILTALATVR